MEINAKIIKLIKGKSDYSMNDFIAKLGMSRVGFYNMLANNHYKLETIIKIAEILKIPVSEIIEDQNNISLTEKIEQLTKQVEINNALISTLINKEK